MKRESITSRQNPLVQHLRRLQSSRSYREETGEYCADGLKLLEEAARWAQLKTVVLTKGVQPCALPEGVRVVEVPAELMQYLSQMRAPQGALFTCALPENTQREPAPGTLVLDGIQDPGNLGTILRTADALGVPVILSDGCADPYNAKTVRASMGAVFRTSPGFLSRGEILRACKSQGVPLAVTALHRDAVDLRQAEPGRCCVVIGSEGQGVCRDFLDAAQLRLVIPMQPDCESLNAAIAAAIVMWQMKL